MRDIKFRAWDSNAGCFVYFGIGQSCVKHYHDNERWTFEIDGNTKAYQFTGLKDANGVEIYEGDIIRYVDKGKIKTLTRLVIYEECGFGVMETDSCFHCLGGICTDENHEGSHIGFVIGNIYENPELLKGKDNV